MDSTNLRAQASSGRNQLNGYCRLFRASILLLLTWTPGIAQNAGAHLEVSLRKTSWKIAEHIDLFLKLTSDFDGILTVNENIPAYNYHAEVWTQDGHRVPPTVGGKDAWGQTPEILTRNFIKLLSKGESVQDGIDLVEYFQLTKAGHYLVFALRTVDSEDPTYARHRPLTAVSEPIEFDIR